MKKVLLFLALAFITHYSDLSSCHNVRPDGRCQTASGYATMKGTAACSREIPFGTILQIGKQKVVCLDRYAKYLDKERTHPTVDIFVPESREEGMRFGKKLLEVKIIKI